jgi:hypothetical protein
MNHIEVQDSHIPPDMGKKFVVPCLTDKETFSQVFGEEICGYLIDDFGYIENGQGHGGDNEGGREDGFEALQSKDRRF